MAAAFGLFTLPFSLSGQPAISLPLHWSADGLPIGVQVIADVGREDTLLRLAAQLEQAIPWRHRFPCIFA
jgi:amidase